MYLGSIQEKTLISLRDSTAALRLCWLHRQRVGFSHDTAPLSEQFIYFS